MNNYINKRLNCTNMMVFERKKLGIKENLGIFLFIKNLKLDIFILRI